MSHFHLHAVLGYRDSEGNYLPPYNWWADSAAKRLVDQVNKFYKGTGVQFFLREASANAHMPDCTAPKSIICQRICTGVSSEGYCWAS